MIQPGLAVTRRATSRAYWVKMEAMLQPIPVVTPAMRMKMMMICIMKITIMTMMVTTIVQ